MDEPVVKGVHASCYLVFEPEHNYRGELIGVKVDRLLKERPPRLGAKSVAIHLTFGFDARLFQQYLPEIFVPVLGSSQLMLPAVMVDTPVGDVDGAPDEDEP